MKLFSVLICALLSFGSFSANLEITSEKADEFVKVLLQAIGCQKYPFIKLNANNTVSIFVDKDDSSLFVAAAKDQGFHEELKPGFYAEHNKAVIEVIEEDNCIEVKINISAIELDSALKRHWKYLGYREGKSLLGLLPPELPDTNLIHLFPVAKLDESPARYVVRGAGCQLSETMSVQLRNLLPKTIEKTHKLHWGLPEVKEFFGVDSGMAEQLLHFFISNNRMSLSNARLNLQSEGTYMLREPQVKGPVVIVPLDDKTKLFYAYYTQLPLEDLHHFYSVAVDKIYFFETVVKLLKESIESRKQYCCSEYNWFYAFEEETQNAIKNIEGSVLKAKIEKAQKEIFLNHARKTVMEKEIFREIQKKKGEERDCEINKHYSRNTKLANHFGATVNRVKNLVVLYEHEFSAQSYSLGNCVVENQGEFDNFKLSGDMSKTTVEQGKIYSLNNDTDLVIEFKLKCDGGELFILKFIYKHGSSLDKLADFYSSIS